MRVPRRLIDPGGSRAGDSDAVHHLALTPEHNAVLFPHAHRAGQAVQHDREPRADPPGPGAGPVTAGPPAGDPWRSSGSVTRWHCVISGLAVDKERLGPRRCTGGTASTTRRRSRPSGPRATVGSAPTACSTGPGTPRTRSTPAAATVFIDNFRVVHRPNSFLPHHDGSDRWLKRLTGGPLNRGGAGIGPVGDHEAIRWPRGSVNERDGRR